MGTGYLAAAMNPVPLLWILGVACGVPQVPLDGFDMELLQSDVVPTVYTATVALPVGVDRAVIAVADEPAGPFQAWTELDPLSTEPTPVLGLPAGRTLYLRAEADRGGEHWQSPVYEIDTGYAPSNLPTTYVTDDEAGQHVGGFVFTSFLEPSTALVFDREGSLVWWYQPRDDSRMGRVLPSPDGRGVYMGDLNLGGFQSGSVTYMSWDGSEIRDIPVARRHHDFLVRDDGTIAAIVHDPRDVDGLEVLGAALVEVRPDGGTRTVWSVWDHHEVWAGVERDVPGSSLEDWPHANALSYVPEQDLYLLSVLLFEGVIAIDATTGEERWVVGGEEATLAHADNPDEFRGGVHGAELVGDELMVFANGQGDSARAETVRLDLDAGTATETWRYAPGYASPILGDVQRVGDDHVLALFAYNGELHEVDADGNLLWRLGAELGGVMSYLTWVPAL